VLQGKECHSFPHDVALQGIIDAVAPEHDHGGGEALGSTPGISPSKQADNMCGQCSFTLWMLSCRGLSMQWLLSKTRMWVRP